LLAVRLAVVLALATLSYKLVELPVRERRLPRPVAVVGWANGAVAVAAVFALVAVGVPTARVSLRAEGQAPPPPPTTVPAPAPTTLPTAAVAATAPVRTQALGTRAAAGPRPATPATSTPTTTPPPPVRVLVYGDSLAENLAKGLTAWSARSHALVVWDHGVLGCPISRGGTRRKADGTAYPTSPLCSWWGTPDSARQISEFHPDVVLVVGGLNDLYDRKLPEWSDYLHPTQPVFDTWLLSEYAAAADTFAASGAPVLWTVPPCVDWAMWGPLVQDGEARRQYQNHTLLPALGAARHLQFADLDAQLCPAGAFDPNALGMTDSRPDGLHMTDAASAALAERWLGPLVLQAAHR
jgi:lysophospholipase L1-like esterase